MDTLWFFCLPFFTSLKNLQLLVFFLIPAQEVCTLTPYQPDQTNDNYPRVNKAVMYSRNAATRTAIVCLDACPSEVRGYSRHQPPTAKATRAQKPLAKPTRAQNSLAKTTRAQKPLGLVSYSRLSVSKSNQPMISLSSTRANYNTK